MEATVATGSEGARRDALAGRLFEAALGAFDLLTVYLGVRLGLYRALAEHGSATPPEMARRAGVHERYAREWLEQQAVGGILDVDLSADDPSGWRYTLPAGHAEVFLDPESLAAMAPLATFLVGAAKRTDDLLAAYRTGAGVGWERYGPEVHEAQELQNRPVFAKLLTTEWLPALPDVEARLRRVDPPARVADLACGTGWSTIAMARAYPAARAVGLDLDPWSIQRARENAAAAGMADRAVFEERDAADPALAGAFDLVTIIEAVHDLSQPVAVLSAARGLLAPGGAALVVDERVAERFTAPGEPIDRIMYGYSLMFCLPNGLASQPSAATGTVMRPDTLRRYATEAGFSGFKILPVEHETFRLYRLDP